MAKQAYVYSGTEWVPLASEVTNLSAYQTKALNEFPYRNLVINGAMQVAQRGTSVASITTSGYRTADRFTNQIDSLGTWTQSVENDAPTGSGFRKSLKMLVTTADASPANDDYCIFSQFIEGQNVQQIAKGTSSAKQLTLSFWVKSNVTGTYVAALYDNDNNRQVCQSYTISASATWEKKTITFPADTTGAFDNDNATSLIVNWFLAVGNNWKSGTLATSWASYVKANDAVGQTNLASATNNYWQITGVQLEVGDTATPFEFKSFAKDLEECERYYQKSYNQSTVPGANIAATADSTAQATIFAGWGTASAAKMFTVQHKVRMRTSPTISTWDLVGNSGKVSTFDTGFTRTDNVSPVGGNGSSETAHYVAPGTSTVNGWGYAYTLSAEL